MTRIFNDPLLNIARFFIVLVMAIFVVALLAIIIALPAIGMYHSQVIAALAEDGAPAAALWAIVALMLLAAAVISLCWLFLRHMKRIIDTVAAGDPFVPENADRLRAMGWLVLIIYLIGIPLGAIAMWMASVTEGADIRFTGDLGGGGIVLCLTLFILARVFRKGTEMREELEGTI